MPSQCIIKFCRSNYYNGNERLFVFPVVRKNGHKKRNAQLRRRAEKWQNACKIAKLPSNARICSKHFVSGKPVALEEEDDIDWVPSLHLSAHDVSTWNDDRNLDMKDKNLSVQAINNTMKLDNTTCCSNKGLNKKAGTTPVAKKGQKRPSDAGEVALPGAAKIPDKRPSPVRPIAPVQQISGGPPAKKSKSNDEVVCTPDILSMFMSPEEPPPLVAAGRPGPAVNKPVVPTGGPIPSLQNRQVLVRPAAPNAMPVRMAANSQANSVPPPVYHTINGYRIDLHTAAQQGTYRLPNGKLIQVRKQAPVPTVPSTIVPPRTNVTIAPKPMYNPASMAQNPAIRMTNGAGVHLNYALQQQQQLQEQRLQQQRQQQQMLQQQRMQQAAIPPGQPQPTIVAGLPNPALQLPTLALLQSMVNGVHEDSPLGKSRKDFEGKLLSGVEICQHIVNKINTLTNSNSFKNIRNVRDLKELYIHVSYLLTYAIGRFKTLQEKCVDDVKKMGFTKESDFVMMGEQISNRNPDEDKSDDEGDCEIVEQCTTLIEIDSEDEDDAKKKKEDASKALNTSETEAAVAAIMEDRDEANTSGEPMSMEDFLQVSMSESPEKKAPGDDDDGGSTVVLTDSSSEKLVESADEKKEGGATEDDMVELIEAPEEDLALSGEVEAKEDAEAKEGESKESEKAVEPVGEDEKKTVDDKVPEVPKSTDKVDDVSKEETSEVETKPKEEDSAPAGEECKAEESSSVADRDAAKEDTPATVEKPKEAEMEVEPEDTDPKATENATEEVSQPATEEEKVEAEVQKESTEESESSTEKQATAEMEDEPTSTDPKPAEVDEDVTDDASKPANEEKEAEVGTEEPTTAAGEAERSETAEKETVETENQEAPEVVVADQDQETVQTKNSEASAVLNADQDTEMGDSESANNEKTETVADDDQEISENIQEDDNKADEELESAQSVAEEKADLPADAEDSSSELLDANAEQLAKEDCEMESDVATEPVEESSSSAEISEAKGKAIE